MIPDKLHTKLSYKLVGSPVGVLKLVASEKGLVAILWENDNPRRVRLGDTVEEPLHAVLVRTEMELEEYFGGKRRTFSIAPDMVHLFKNGFGKPCWLFPVRKHAHIAI